MTAAARARKTAGARRRRHELRDAIGPSPRSASGRKLGNFWRITDEGRDALLIAEAIDDAIAGLNAILGRTPRDES